MPTKVFNSKDLLLFVAGIPIKGFSGKGIVEVNYKNQRSELVSGVNGETIFVNNGDLSADITFSLFQTSTSNFPLNLLLFNPLPVIPILIRSVYPGYIGFGIKARLISRPKFHVKKEIGEVDWQIVVADWYSVFTRSL